LTASLIVVVLIVIALFPLLRALSTSLFVSADTEANIIALNLAIGKVEEIRNASFADVSSEAKAQIARFPRFQREVAVTPLHAKLKNVTITVSWKDSTGVEKGVTLETYAADY
jgi:hypothetical protein